MIYDQYVLTTQLNLSLKVKLEDVEHRVLEYIGYSRSFIELSRKHEQSNTRIQLH